MARISDEELERIKQDIPVAALAEAAGVKLAKQGKDLVGLCPFHDDKEPSLVITPSKNLWHCLGACDAGGSPIDWVMAAEGVSFRHAVELIREGHTSSPVASSRRPPKGSTKRKLPAPVEIFADDRSVLERVVAYYHQTLLGSPEALGYLARRGIGDRGLIDKFRIGFANRTLGYRLPNKKTSAGGEIRGRLQALGVLRASGHEHLSGSVVIPIISADGSIRQLYGRKITKGLRSGTPDHLYLPGPLAGVFNEAGTAGKKEVVLTESLIDALSFVAAGIEGVTASFGVSGFTDEILDALKAGGCERVLIAYDPDEAGNLAATRLAEQLAKEGLDSYRVTLPEGIDANEYATAPGQSPGALRDLVSGATWMGKAPKAGAQKAPAVAGAPTPAPGQVEARIEGGDINIKIAGRAYRMRGLEKNRRAEEMRVNLAVTSGESFFVDTLDLYSSRARAAFVKAAGAELNVKAEILAKDLGTVVLKAEELQDAAAGVGVGEHEMSEAEREAALNLLEDPDLIGRLRTDLKKLGVVGEEENLLISFLAAVSRLDTSPLAVIYQSSPAAGKSSLMGAICSLTPEEELVTYSAMTGQSLFYMGEEDLSHKLLAIAEEEGAARAAYSIKILSSEGELRLASVGKDPDTGKHVTHTYIVRGPAAIFLTTTAAEIDDEIISRAIVLSAREDAAQTAAIHEAQRHSQTLEGLKRRAEADQVRALYKNAQRLLEPVAVINPFAEGLDFSDRRTRARRDHAKYLALIRAAALLHQHQREQKTLVVGDKEIGYIEATVADVALADELAPIALSGAGDDLAPQTRRLLGLIGEMLTKRAGGSGREAAEIRFTRRELREASGYSEAQVRVHLARLTEMEYVIAHRAGAGMRFDYELAYFPDGEPRGGSLPVRGGVVVGSLSQVETDFPSSEGESEGVVEFSGNHLREGGQLSLAPSYEDGPAAATAS